MEEMFERDDKYLWREMELDKGQEQRERDGSNYVVGYERKRGRGRQVHGRKLWAKACY